MHPIVSPKGVILTFVLLAFMRSCVLTADATPVLRLAWALQGPDLCMDCA